MQEKFEQAKLRAGYSDELTLEVIKTLNFYPDASGYWYSYYYVDASGVYEYTGFEFYPALLFPAEPGKKWVVEELTLADGNGFPVDTRLEASARLDTVRVPAGEFEALRVELNFYDYDYWLVYKQKRIYWQLIRWYAEGYGLVREFDGYSSKFSDLIEFIPRGSTGGGG